MRILSFLESTPNYLLSLLLRKKLLIALVVISSLMLGHGNAQALSTGCLEPQSCPFVLYFDGAERYNTGWGAQAIIGDYQVKSVCISSSAWSMIDNQSGDTELAQAGYLRLAEWSTTQTYYFYEWGDTSTLYDPVMYDVDNKNWGSSDKFAVYYDSGSQYTKMLINNQLVASVYTGWNANDQQWFAETHSDADYTVGGYNHHSIFATVQYLQNGTWYNINAPSDMYNNQPNASYSASGNQFYVWDKRVP